MASVFSISEAAAAPAFTTELARADRAIGGPRFDAILLWGAPLVAFAIIAALALVAASLPPASGLAMAAAMSATMAVVTYSHLIAVVPRAYLNREVFAGNRLRLTVVPVLVIAALASSPVALVAGIVLAVFWDVHHSAMQTFGIGRIYDMKAGNDPLALRRIDLLLNVALYIGPAAAGASMIVHFHSFDRFGGIGWPALASVPSLVSGRAGAIHVVALVAWAAIVGAALVTYVRARAEGYQLSAHKLALLVSTACVSILAWCLAPPFIAFAIVNLFHAMQYFAIVWLKEGGRIGALLPRSGRLGLPLFLAACGGFGIAYLIAAAAGPAKAGALLAPFVACSLLHFWFDAFIWSVRKKQV